MTTEAEFARLMARTGHVALSIGPLLNAAWLHMISGTPVVAGWDADPINCRERY